MGQSPCLAQQCLPRAGTQAALLHLHPMAELSQVCSVRQDSRQGSSRCASITVNPTHLLLWQPLHFFSTALFLFHAAPG